MICYNFHWFEEENIPNCEVLCGECGNPFEEIEEEVEGSTYSHYHPRCGKPVTLTTGKKTTCVLPVHEGKCPQDAPFRTVETKEDVRVYTDGGCRGDLGGWGWWCADDNQTNYGFEEKTTNQRMELYAALDAIDHYLELPNLVIVSDSAYLVNCMNQKWYKRWQDNGWRNAKGQPIANKDLWEGLIKFVTENPRVKFEKVKGHSGDKGNDKADELATQGMVDYSRMLDNGTLSRLEPDD